MSRLIFRGSPRHGPSRLGPRPAPRRARPATLNGGRHDDRARRPADHRRDRRRRDRRARATRDVAVVDGRLRLLGRDGATARANVGQTIDATGKVVAPGFIDLHSHGGLVILAEPRHEPKVRQGVTTELVGVDGNGFAPFERREDLEAFVELDAGLDGRPDDRLRLDIGRELPRPLRRHGQPQRRDAGRQLASSGSPPLGWDDVPADDARPRPDARRCSRDAMARRRRSGSAPGSTTRPAATRRPRSSRR